MEQRKRLSIGVELAARPELLLFLDEPTSGLDSQTAWSVTSLIKTLSDNGQAVLCTIHQPSAVLFENFDELLLLKSGGSVVYNGPLGNDSRTLIDYFEQNGGRKCSPRENPAEVCILKLESSFLAELLSSICWKSLEPETLIIRGRTGAMCGPTRQSPSSFLRI